MNDEVEPQPMSETNILKPSLEDRIAGAIEKKRMESDTRIGKDAPFIFGQRYLEDEEAVFQHNAWDHVEWGEDQVKDAQEKISKQYEAPVSEFDKKRYNGKPEKFWDIFYKNNRENFFKDRKWLQIEFPLLYKVSSNEYNGSPVTILEVGCGAGNTMFPVLRQNQNKSLKIIGADFSKVAVDLVKQSEDFQKENAEACVWDLADINGKLPGDIKPHSVDIVVMIFVFSALAPSQWDQALSNLNKLLKPGGKILFRDYGRYDLAQVRFKKNRLLDDNFYIRGDGTRVYFFDQDELENIFKKSGGFNVEKIGTDRRLLVNRKKQLKMYRIWMQAVFEKPIERSTKELMSRLALSDSEEEEEDDGCTPPITCGCESCSLGHGH